VPGVDNKKFKELILKDPQPFIKDTKDTDYVLTRHEDTKFPMNPEFEKVLNHINAQFNYITNKKLKLINFWSHIHEKNMSTGVHNHVEKEDYEGNIYLSGVYYVQVPEKSGHLVLLYPHNSHVINKFHIMPRASEFFLFPSTMDHCVTRNLSNDLRISVSFNYKIEDMK
jgi:hypothetical protein